MTRESDNTKDQLLEIRFLIAENNQLRSIIDDLYRDNSRLRTLTLSLISALSVTLTLLLLLVIKEVSS